MLGAVGLGMPLPLLPLQQIPPIPTFCPVRRASQNRLCWAGANGWAFWAVGMLQAVLTLGRFAWALESKGLEQARNLAFTSLVFGELFRAFGARSQDKTIFELGFLTNWRLLLVVLVSALIQVLIHHVPIFQQVLQLGPLSLSDCVLTIGLGMIPLVAMEGWKLLRRGAQA